jgi:predicted DNA-binding ribbon-helix-helix protein
MTPDLVRKRSVRIGGRRTSVCVEAAFWRELHRLAQARGSTLAELVAAVDRNRRGRSLSSSLRLHVLEALTAEVIVLSCATTPAPIEISIPVRAATS